MARKFFGVILIINGAALCFAGSIYLFALMAGVVFLGVVGLICGGASNFNFVTLESKKYMIALVVVVALALGGVAAYFAYNLGEKYGMTIMAAVLGFAIGIVGCTVGKVKSALVKAGVCIFLAGLGYYIGKTYTKYANSIVTACVGAFMLIVGISEYDPKAPDFFSSDEFLTEDGQSVDISSLHDKRTIAYLVGIVVFSAAGSFIQLKYVASELQDDDDMFHKDNA